MDITNWTPSFWLRNEADCLNILKSNYSKIPFLNVTDLQNLQHNKLVRFRGMVQDMYNPEYYLEKYVVINERSQDTSIRNGKYVDTADCKDNEVIDYESKNNVTGERYTYVAISVPGLNKWVEDIEKETYEVIPPTLEVGNCQEKRSLESDENMETQSNVTQSTGFKKLCVNNEKQKPALSVSTEHILNFPLPDRRGKACHLKVYHDASTIKLNEVFDFVGFLSVDPVLTNLAYHNGDQNVDSEMEIQTHNPPPSLIPRIHCVAWEKLKHANPIPTKPNMCSQRIEFLKRELHIVLTQLLLGDELAAEYLLYHLISGVYLRKDLLALGKFTLNISNISIKTIPDYCEKIYKFIELLIPKSHYFPMTLENMNEVTFIPKKDYECNRLRSGLLQLSDNTHLVLDETKLSAGKLHESGVKAVGALSHIMKNQKLPYDFNYYRMDFDCDIPILICSEGKSFLPSDCHVVLTPEDVCVRTFKEILDAASQFLKSDLLNDIRSYLTVSRLRKYEIGEDTLELVQNEFVHLRQKENASADDLHSLLVLARLVCLSEGKSTLDEISWKKACELESRRKERPHK